MNARKKEAPLPPVEPGREIDLPVTPEMLGIMREQELPRIVEALKGRIATLSARVRQAQEADSTTARGALLEEIEGQELLKGREALRGIHTSFDGEAARIQANDRLSDLGKREALDRAAERRNEAAAAERARLLGLADSLVKRAPAPAAPKLTPEVSAQIMARAAMFPISLPEDMLSQALEDLEVATSLDAPEELRETAAAILYHAVRPLLRRRSTAPEKFSAGFSELHGEALATVETFLGARGARRQTAEALRDEFTAAYDSLDRLAKQAGGWDDFVVDVNEGDSSFFG